MAAAPATGPLGRQPWLHNLAVTVRGNVTVLSERSGQITGSGVEGVWVDDRRMLSQLVVEIGGEAPIPLSDRAIGGVGQFLGSARALASWTPDPVVEVVRTRRHTSSGVRESLLLRSRLATAVAVPVRLTLAADGAPVALVKAGLTPEVRLVPELVGDTVRFVGRGVDALVAPPAQLGVRIEGDEVTIGGFVDVPAAGAVELVLDITLRRTHATAFDADPGHDLVGWEDVAVVAADPRIAPMVADSLADLRGLLLTDPLSPTDVFVGAGTPWYLTLFGRDSLWAALLTLPLGLELSRGTLWALARRQGTRSDPQTAEEMGKIPHEVRRYGADGEHSVPTLPPVYYGTVDATALWVLLLAEARRWGLPDADVAGLLTALEGATSWILDHAAPESDGLLKYLDASGHGLTNQGWKDSGDAIRFRDGSLATAPIALVEAQAYAVQALREAADILAEFGRPGADRARAEADALAERVQRHFWVSGEPAYLGLAVDGRGRLVDGLGSNMAHVLGRGVLTAAQVDDIATALTGPELLDDFGLRTLGSGNGGFNPLGYHTGSVWTHDTAIAALGLSREGRTREAVLLCRGLLRAAEAFDYRWPELHAGGLVLGRPVPYPAACRPQGWSAASAIAVISVLFGLDPDAATRTLHVRPIRPAPFGPVQVTGLRFLGGRVDLAVDASGEVSVLHAPEGVTVRVH